MTEPTNAVLAAEIRFLSQRIEKLETNQRTGIVAILMLVMKSVFEVVQKGAI